MNTQVPEGRGNKQGYVHYLSISEWWRLRTPLSQWFTKNFTSVWLPLADQLDIDTGHARDSARLYRILHLQTALDPLLLLLKVLRRPSYKGAVCLAETLPVDASSILGTVLVLACVLPTSTLTADAVATCQAVLKELEKHIPTDATFRMLPEDPLFVLQLRDGRVSADDLKQMMRTLGLSWRKLLDLASCTATPRVSSSCYVSPVHLRLARKLPEPISHTLAFSSVLLAMMRLRGDRDFWQSVLFRRMLKRSMHSFCQAADAGLSAALLDDCPCPDTASKYHPFMRSSRLRGNKALEMGIVNKFMVRGGGFVSTKTDTFLSDLGIVKQRAALAQRTSGEYVARSLTKQADFLAEVLGKQDMKTINIAVDAASVCHEQAGLHVYVPNPDRNPIRTCLPGSLRGVPSSWASVCRCHSDPQFGRFNFGGGVAGCGFHGQCS